MKTIMIKNVPEQLRNEFKAICARKGSTMSAEILKFIKQVVEKEVKKRV
jgi:plasmid stability protein